MEAKLVRKCRWTALGMTAVFFVLIALFFDVRMGNDDSILLRATMGYESGEPAVYNLYLHGLLMRPLRWLGLLWPGVPFFSGMQVAFLALALTVISANLMMGFGRRGHSRWLGAALAAVVYAAFGLEYTTSYTFTITAAFLGAAAVTQVLVTDPRKPFLGMLGAAALASLAYALREVTLWPVLAFCGVAFLAQLLDSRAVKPLLRSLIPVALLLLCVVGTRQLEHAFLADPDYERWNAARSSVQDYYDLSDLTDEDLSAVGLDRNAIEMARNWCFVDESLTAEAFEALEKRLEAEPVGLADTLRIGWRAILRRVERSPYECALLGIGLFAGLFAALAALFRPGKRLILLGTLACAAAALGAMLLALGIGGRLPMRAVLVPALPALALVLGLLPSALPKHRFSTAAAAAFALAMAVFASVQLEPLWPLMVKGSAPASSLTDLEAYARTQPDRLFLYDGSMTGTDIRPFPQSEIPMNVTNWGGWNMRSPENRALFERFSLSPSDKSAYLDGRILVASTEAEPPAYFLNWLGEGVTWQVYAQAGEVNVFTFATE